MRKREKNTHVCERARFIQVCGKQRRASIQPPRDTNADVQMLDRPHTHTHTRTHFRQEIVRFLHTDKHRHVGTFIESKHIR